MNEHTDPLTPPPGAWYEGDGIASFTLWAPRQKQLQLKILGDEPRLIPLVPDEYGYCRCRTDGVRPGTRYLYVLDDGSERPDPASFWQPDGVHAASALVDHAAFHWGEDAGFKGHRLRELVLYEVHVGTFTPEGTFAAVIPRLAELAELGITALELMPVAQFPGSRNWGYDGVYPFAVQDSYGGVDGLKELVREAHRHGLSVILDVVYNHLGPEGNYLGCFAPYFTDRYRTPWGTAVNYDDAYSFGVRNFFSRNARYWLEQFHIDGLRLDAVHGIVDTGAQHILAELVGQTEEFSRRQKKKYHLIAESDLNDARLVQWRIEGGHGLDAQWSDDFHHSVHALLTGERHGYYVDFGTVPQLVKAVGQGVVYDGGYSGFRKRRHGNRHQSVCPEQLVVCSQNHDQVGNRMQGERLSALVDFEGLKCAAALVLFSAYTPLLFMGEEYAESAPFLYFISHGDANLVEAVRQGRKQEFAAFDWQGEPPDPQSEATFRRCVLNWDVRTQGPHAMMRGYYRELLRLRRSRPVLAQAEKNNMEYGSLEEAVVWWRRWQAREELYCLMNARESLLTVPVQLPAGKWKCIFDSGSRQWDGPGGSVPDIIDEPASVSLSGFEVVLYAKEVLR